MRMRNRVLNWSALLCGLGQLFFSAALLYAQDAGNPALDSENTSEVPVASSSSGAAENKGNEQTENANEKEMRPFYISFVYPLGADFIDSIKYRYVFSLSLLGNVTGGTAGAAFAPVFNASFGDSYGFQAAAVLNLTAGNFNGFQAAAVLNLTAGDFNGLQTAAVLNLTAGDFNGFQAAAVLNLTAGELKGVSLGVVNIIAKDSPYAFPIGLFNVVAGGKFQLGLAASTVFPSGAVVYRMGTKRFYMIYSVGPSVSYGSTAKGFDLPPISFAETFFYRGYALGLGMGFDIPIDKRAALLAEIERVGFSSFSEPTRAREQVIQLRSLIEFKIVERMFFTIGPTANFYFQESQDNVDYQPLWDITMDHNWSFGAGLYLGFAYNL